MGRFADCSFSKTNQRGLALACSGRTVKRCALPPYTQWVSTGSGIFRLVLYSHNVERYSLNGNVILCCMDNPQMFIRLLLLPASLRKLLVFAALAFVSPQLSTQLSYSDWAIEHFGDQADMVAANPSGTNIAMCSIC